MDEEKQLLMMLMSILFRIIGQEKIFGFGQIQSLISTTTTLDDSSTTHHHHPSFLELKLLYDVPSYRRREIVSTLNQLLVNR